jgi:divalent metal cation (Fe/Co/Zn/Cd) transporter
MASAALLVAIIVIVLLLAVLRRSHRKVRELRSSLRKATKWLN